MLQGQIHAPVALFSGKESLVTLGKRLGAFQSWSGGNNKQKNLYPRWGSNFIRPVRNLAVAYATIIPWKKVTARFFLFRHLSHDQHIISR